MTPNFTKWLVCSYFLFCICLTTTAQTTVTVTNNSDNPNVVGSLRRAINAAHTSSTPWIQIRFAANVTSITLNSQLEVYRASGKILDILGGGRVVLRGGGNKANIGFNIDGDGSVGVYGLQFENFSQANYVYASADIYRQIVINANTFINNDAAIVSLSYLTIQGNYFGTNSSLATNLGNNSNILILGASAQIYDNYITSARTGRGIWILTAIGSRTFIERNTIGGNSAALGNFGEAINLVGSGQAYIANNTIANNGQGVSTGGKSELRDNIFYCNKANVFVPSLPYPKPIVDSMYYNPDGRLTIKGRSNAANDVIEIFESSANCTTMACQGSPFRRLITNASRQWSATITPSISTLPTQFFVSASVEGSYHTIEGGDTQGTTSEFTTCALPKCPTAVTVTLQKIQDVSCFGGFDGWARISFTAVGTGGIYTYDVSQTGGGGTGTGLVAPPKIITSFDTVKNLGKGIYTGTIVNTKNNCVYTAPTTITINQPTGPLSINNCRELSPTSSTIATDGRGEITISGGTPPYTISYRRNGGAIVNFGTTSSSVVALPNLATGNYVVTVIDSKYNTGNPKTGCTATCNFTITPPNCTALKATVVSVTNLPCFDSVGSFRVKCVDIATNLPLTLTISNSSGIVSTRTISSGGFPVDSIFTVNNLKAGIYTIALSSRGGACTVTTNTTITQPNKLDIVCDSLINVARVGDATGRVRVITSGGITPYRLSLSGAINRPNFLTVPNQFNPVSINNLIKGNYVATAIDLNGCQDTCRFTITEPNCTGFKLLADPDSIKCFGETNGRIALAVTNGDSNYIFKWSVQSIGNQAIVNNLAVGTYRATVTDGRNCRDSVEAIISTPSLLRAVVAVDSIRTAGGTGTISITASGGTPNYNVELILNNAPRTLTQRNGNTFVFANLGKGTYSYTLTDANGCDTTGTITLNDLICNINIDGKADSVSCKNGTNGGITTTVTNGVAPLVYTWKNAVSTTANAAGLRAATYWVAVSDSRACIDSAYVTVYEPDSLSSVSVRTDVTRVASTDGSIRISVRGGTPAYIVRLSNGVLATRENANSFIFNSLAKGIYTISITDARGCTATKNDTIKEPVCNLTVNTQTDSVNCFGGSDGRISLNVGNAIAPLTVIWSSNAIPANSISAENLPVGTYSAAITDGRGCTINANATLFQPARLTNTFDTTKVTRFDLRDGAITVRVSGGTQPYSVRIGDTIPLIINASTFRFSGLATGTYTYIVTDVYGCTAPFQTVMIEGPICTIRVDSLVDSVRCNGGNTGRITVNATGGIGNLTFAWSPNVATTTRIADNLSAGTYNVTISDGVGCRRFMTAQVFEPTALSSTFNKTNVRVSNGSDGTISIKVVGGTPQYKVQILQQMATFSNDSFRFSGLTANTYTYIVTDAKGCTTTSTVVITAPPCNLTLTKQTVDSVTCNGTATGRIVLTTSGGTGPLSINWSLATIGNTLTANNLPAGNYSTTATDVNGCTASIAVEVFEPARLNSIFNKTNVSVPNGSDGKISIKVVGGTPQYKVQILQQMATFSNDSFRFSGLTANTYTYTVTDAKGCTTTATVVINAPGCNLTLTKQTMDSVTCNGTATGRIVLVSSGGRGPLSINWSLATIGNTLTANNLRAGLYSATATDADGCVASISAEVFEPSRLSSTFSKTNVRVSNGSDGTISIKVVGGTPQYKVEISSQMATFSNDSFRFSGLAANTYTYIVTDAKGCTTTETVVINPLNCSITAQISIGQAISCFGATDGSINLSTNSGTPQYNWSNGTTQQNLTNVGAGTYKVTITDAQNCTQTAEITLPQPAQIRATIAGDTAICGGQSARLRFSVVGTTNFSLVFSDGTNNTTATNLTASVTPTATTTYTLVSVQSGACLGSVSGSAAVQVTTVAPPTIISIQRDSLCGGSDLTITTPASALPNVQYLWQTPNGAVPTPTPILTIRNANSSHSGLYALKVATATCQSAATPSIRVTVLDVPAQGANGGGDKVECGGTTTSLNAQTIASQHIKGNWIALDGATIAQPNSSNTTVSGLKTGNNRFVWTLTSSLCGKIGSDTVKVFLEKTPVALDRKFNLEGTLGSILINIRGLVQDSANVKFSITAPTNGSATIQNNRFLLFERGNLTAAQTVEIPYQICAVGCPSLCSGGKLFINVAQLIVNTDSLVVEKIFVSNDASKPLLRIENIEKFEENECSIFDRWGAPIWGPKTYINDTPDHAWDGTKNGKTLPNGAYYYVLKYGNKSQKRTERGVIYLVEGL
jgi:gliding motility-associated-like protein